VGLYPVFLEMSGRRCLVVGGGPVAERKVEGLLDASAIVTVVSPATTERLRALALAGRIQHRPRAWTPEDLEGVELTFVATDDGQINARVAREGRRRGVWVNAADDPAHSDFILPALVRRGPLTVAVGTSGASPALARHVREELEQVLGAEYAALAELAGEVRRELRARGRAPDAETWRRALDGDLRGLLVVGRRDDARRRLLERLGVE
jgi:precorrin-2 dehydrogenase/sirohydrochlorin ferrochelatase